tara:strand:+ start:524 stop:1570 length:1047 start_codon:yes stop_codon:yes gene_type:complete
MAWEKLGTASVGGAVVANTSWKELGRTTLGSSSAEVDKSSLTAKDNIMILAYYTGDSTADSFINFNGDEAGNYANRYSRDGGSDSTDTSQSVGLRLEQGRTTPQFSVMNIINNSAQEKLVNGHTVSQNTAGAGNAPHRQEWVGKWANTSAQITQATLDRGSGNFTSGSEIVVLGCDNDEADSGTNFWQELASVDLSSGADEISTGTIASKKYIMWNYHVLSSGAANALDNIAFRFNNDTGNNYCYRHSDNGGSDGTNTSNSYLRFRSGSATAQDFFGSGYIVNKSDKEKLLISEQIYNGGDGASSQPKRSEMVGKWANTSAQITEIDLIQDGGGDFLTGSYLQVFGAD